MEGFGISHRPYSLEEMLLEGILNDPKELYVVFIIGRKGKAYIHINLRRHTVDASSLIVLLPKQHIDIDRTDDFLCDYIYYTFDFMVAFPFTIHPSTVEKINKKQTLSLPPDDQVNLDEGFRLLSRQYGRWQHPSRGEIVKASLFLFIAEISRIYSELVINFTTTHAEHLAEQFFKLVHDNHIREHKPAFYAAGLCLSVRYLSKVLKQVTGKSLNSWVTEFSIMGAKRLLKSTSLTSAQIAEEMNFPNPSFFAKYFKKYTGMTPMQFRQLKQIGE